LWLAEPELIRSQIIFLQAAKLPATHKQYHEHRAEQQCGANSPPRDSLLDKRLDCSLRKTSVAQEL
jgi:hypothetical protein